MPAIDDTLWNGIAAFPLDDPQSTFPFSARLARDMCWSRAHTQRCIEEYRRFVYLACAAGHPVTPSEDVDAVWHLHLTYSRSYWRELCDAVLGRPLHHGPTRGGSQESSRYRAQYDATLEAYRGAFGENPPADIWPDADTRFAPTGRIVVDPQSHWIIPKRPFRAIWRAIRGKATVAAVLLGSTGLAAAAGSQQNFLGLTPTQQYVAGGALLGLFLVWTLLFRKSGKGNNNDSNGCGSGCSSGCGGD